MLSPAGRNVYLNALAKPVEGDVDLPMPILPMTIRRGVSSVMVKCSHSSPRRKAASSFGRLDGNGMSLTGSVML